MKKEKQKLIYNIIKISLLVLCILNIVCLLTPYISASKEYKETLLEHPDEKFDEGFYITNKEMVNISFIEYYKINKYAKETETSKGDKIDRRDTQVIMIIIVVSMILLLLFVLLNKNVLPMLFNCLLLINVNLLNLIFIKSSAAIVRHQFIYGFSYYLFLISPLIILLLIILKKAMEKHLEWLTEKENKITKVIKTILSYWFIPVILVALVMCSKVFLSIRDSFKDYDEGSNKTTETKKDKKQEMLISEEVTTMTRDNIEFSFSKISEVSFVVTGKNKNEGKKQVSLVFYFYDKKDKMIFKDKILLNVISYNGEFADKLSIPESYYRYEVSAFVEDAKENEYIDINNFTVSEVDSEIVIKSKTPLDNDSLQAVVVFYKENKIVDLKQASREYDRKTFKNTDTFKCSEQFLTEYDNYKVYINNA